MAAVSLIKEKTDISIRVVNVVDLLTLERISDDEFNNLFPTNVPVIFAFHGYKSAVEGLIYNRDRKFVVHGYEEEGAITTPFDMRVLNKIDRYNLTIDVINTLNKNLELKEYCEAKLKEHRELITTTGKDLIEVTDWKWKC